MQDFFCCQNVNIKVNLCWIYLMYCIVCVCINVFDDFHFFLILCNAFCNILFNLKRTPKLNVPTPQLRVWAKPKQSLDSRFHVKPSQSQAWVSNLPLSQAKPLKLNMKSLIIKRRLKHHGTLYTQDVKKVHFLMSSLIINLKSLSESFHSCRNCIPLVYTHCHHICFQ